jgi:hypothetical protein
MTIAFDIFKTITERGYCALTITCGYLVLPMNAGRVLFPVPAKSEEKRTKQGKLRTAHYTYEDGSVLVFNEQNLNSKWKVR